MSESKSNLGLLLPELFAEERRTTEAPSMEEILAYLNGELSPSAQEELQSRLAVHPASTQLLLDLSDPSRLEKADDADPLRPDPRVLERKLRDEGLFNPPVQTLPKQQEVPSKKGQSSGALATGVHPFYRWATAALLVLSSGLGIELVRQRQPISPADVAVWELLPQDESGQRGGVEVVEALPGFSHDLLLYSAEISPNTSYQVAIVDAEAEEALRRSARTNAAGRVVLRLADSDLAAGRFEIRLFTSDDLIHPIAVYGLDWRHP